MAFKPLFIGSQVTLSSSDAWQVEISLGATAFVGELPELIRMPGARRRASLYI